jgi:orotate phosphoribosyltransferase
MGASLFGRVLIIDDVITAGTTIDEAVRLIKAAGAMPIGIAIALDREERGQGQTSAITEVEQRHGLKVITIASLSDLLTYIKDRAEFVVTRGAIESYRMHYGVWRDA